jgi:sigma-B regulation protein RsbU (phosphoserine phosphatase)
MMPYRWKLLILFVTISLVPIVVLRIYGVRNVRFLEKKLVSESYKHLIGDAENRLRLLVDSYSAFIWAGREHFQTVLMFQAREVEGSLAKDVATPPKVYLARDFNEGSDLPSDTILSPIHFRTLPNGSVDRLKISYSEQVFKLAPGVIREDVAEDTARLSTMTPIYKSLSKRLEGLSFWHYTSLENGLHSSYPGHNAIPKELDARMQPWYRGAFENEVPWSDPYVDPETRQVVIAATTRIKRPNGKIAGVTAIVLPISQLLERRLLVQNTPLETESFLVYLETPQDDGQKRARIFAHEEHMDVVHRHWKAQISSEWLTSGDMEQFQALMNKWGTRHN